MIRLLLFTAFWIWFGIETKMPFWGGVLLYLGLLLFFWRLNEALKPCYVSEEEVKELFGEDPAEETPRVGAPVKKESAPRTIMSAVNLTAPYRYTRKNYLMLCFYILVFGSIIYQLFF